MSQQQKQGNAKETDRHLGKHDDAEAKLNDQDPGHRQKENQNKQKEDPLAA